jgi:hypothetical protein
MSPRPACDECGERRALLIRHRRWPHRRDGVNEMRRWIAGAVLVIGCLDTSAYGETRKGSGTITGILRQTVTTT